MRTWVKATGYPVSDRGRVAREIIDAFFAAHPEVYERADTFELVHATARTPARPPTTTNGRTRTTAGSARSTRSSSSEGSANTRCCTCSASPTSTSG
ncbi:hypothetical protein GT755_00160 [Herbidospora sp. NEAU-GS84]|uniref:Lsr2 DNA-binding domain-containing protein n=1 Tax=Herbidospora solisilvae TaxID=2696284 RepID=A0A7C9MZQ6_9ACTN|nr:hypothetical protein [Herbidospora solisilvae]